MISFRYHLVSIVAVFLALAVGVLVGTTVLDQGIVARLRAQTEEFSRTADQLRERVGDLEDHVGLLEQFGDEILPLIASGRLAGREVVVVTHEGVEGDLVSEARRALDLAGATVVAELAMDSRISSRDPAVREELAEILGVAPLPTDALAQQAGLAVADRLADGPELDGDPGVLEAAAAPEDDLLGRLLSAGFLVSRSGISESDLASIGLDGQVVLVLAGARGHIAVNPGPFMVPLVEELVSRGVPTAAGESLTSEFRFVPVLRTDSLVAQSDRIVTVDDLDGPAGGAALILALDDLLRLGRGGHYGFKDGATSALPSG